MNKRDYRLFTDSDVIDPLPPIYKGPTITLYPGQLLHGQNTRGGQAGDVFAIDASAPRGRHSGLRRYIFRYEGEKFVYLATRKGQRNGGFNSKPTQTKISFILIAPPNINVLRQFSFTEINDDGEEVWTESLYSIIKYNNLSTRWEWLTRPVPPAGQQPGQFYVNAFTESTSNGLRNTGSVNLIQWTHVSDPWDTASPQVPASHVTLEPIAWYNNNTVDNLNKWPITNVDADLPSGRRKWQTWNDTTGVVVPDRRPDCLSDDYLKRCFQGVNLKHYDIVFVEVMWRYFAHRNSIDDIRNKQNPVNWGYDSNGYFRPDIHDIEWWSPAPVKTKRQKGRVYRIGGLEADTGVGGVDKVIWAQRTRVITTDYKKGGQTALE